MIGAIIWLSLHLIVAVLVGRIVWLAYHPRYCLCWDCGATIRYTQVPPDRCRDCYGDRW